MNNAGYISDSAAVECHVYYFFFYAGVIYDVKIFALKIFLTTLAIPTLYGITTFAIFL